jgi:hypothetical protein
LLFAAVEGSFRINMPPYHDKMLAVLKGAGIACVEWRMFYNNDEGDLDSIIATFSDGSRGPLPEVAVEDNIYVILWDLADDERIGGMGAWTNGLYVLDVNERSVARTADVFYDYDRQFDDTERILEERWHEYLDWDGKGEFPFWTLVWKRRIGEKFDEEAFEREQEEKIDMEDYFSVTRLENPQWYSL